LRQALFLRQAKNLLSGLGGCLKRPLAADAAKKYFE
jgi:hypothetical protein